MESENREAVRLHHLMAAVGGFLALYAVLARADQFGSAQTANLLFLVEAVIGRNGFEIAIRLGALAIYGLGVALAVILKARSLCETRWVSLAIDAAAVVVLGCLPATGEPVLCLYPMFFAMAFQWNAFPGAAGFKASTIFSTNNYCQCVTGLTTAVLTHGADGWARFRFFGGTLLSFHAGAAAAGLLFGTFGVQTVWAALMPIGAAAWLHGQAVRKQAQADVSATVCPSITTHRRCA